MSDTEPASQPRNMTEGKGRPTPKRSESQRNRVQPPAPTNRKEALARARQLRKEQAASNRAALQSGDIRAMPARERTPERILARDFIDSRRSPASFVMPLMLLTLVVGVIDQKNKHLANATTGVWLVTIFVIIVESVVISRGLRKEIRARIADPKSVGGASAYAVMRAIMPRRFRLPKPRLNVGDPIPG